MDQTNKQTNKQRYFLRYDDLKLYKRHAIRGINIHTVHRLNHHPWSAKNIKYITEQRIRAKFDLQKCFYKVLFVCASGNLIENV